MRRVLIYTPLLLNLVACLTFLTIREPAKELIAGREHAQQLGTLTVSSGDPYMLIAERPLRQWNEWHGGEVLWIKVVEVLNGPALVATKALGDRWTASHAFRGVPTYGRDSWIRAYAFLIASSLQWLVVGALIGVIVKRREIVANT
jgi:hypothetical protein